jgi:MYXO-CTERM domain-containing protein
MRRASFLALAVVVFPSSALAATYQVGPDKPYQTIAEIVSDLEPGDVVEVDGDATYAGDIHVRPDSTGTPDQKITLRGIRKNGKRPVIQGGAEYGIVLHGSHFVFEGFEVTGASGFCVVHKADDVTIRDVAVHDCPNHGILGTDSESGSLTMEFVEVYACGSDLYEHQIYIATDETMYPGSVFRLQHSYIHDANGGNNVKSRAERNEIYSNWIENPYYHVLDLIGPDGQDPGLAREDSDIVGNVLIQRREWMVARFGGDGTGDTNGRYRFAYNTVILGPDATGLWLRYGLESVAVHDNVFLTEGGSPPLINDGEAAWTNGPQLSAERNFVQSGLTAPAFFTGTVTGADPMFKDMAGGNLVPLEGSPLKDAGAPGAGPAGFEIPSPLTVPTSVPPALGVSADLAPIARPTDATPDIGAYEFGTVVTPGTGGSGAGSGSGSGSGSGTGGGDGIGDEDSNGDVEGVACDCRLPGAPTPAAGAGLLALAALALLRRRK